MVESAFFGPFRPPRGGRIAGRPARARTAPREMVESIEDALGDGENAPHGMVESSLGLPPGAWLNQAKATKRAPCSVIDGAIAPREMVESLRDGVD